MTRDRADDYGDKRQVILETAAGLFAKVGYANTKMLDIGRHCGASKSMLYHYFPAKEDVLFELIREHAQGHFTAMEEVLARKVPPEQRLREFIAMWLRRSLASRAKHTVLMYDLKFLPKRQQQQIVDLERRMIDVLGDLLGQVNAAIRKAGPQHLRSYALLLFGMVNWTDVWFRSTGPIGAEEMAERIYRLFVHGFAAER